MSKDREKEYLEKLGIPSDDYSSVNVEKSFSLDDILSELGKTASKPEKAAENAPSQPKTVENSVDNVKKPTDTPVRAATNAPKSTPAPTAAERHISKNDIFAKIDRAEGKPEPKAVAPKVEVKPEQPKVEVPKVEVKPEQPKEVAPKIEAPKAEPMADAEATKVIPKVDAEATKVIPVTEEATKVIPAVEEPTKAVPKVNNHRPVMQKVPMKDTQALKLFSTIEIEGAPAEFNVEVEEGGEPKVDGNTVVFAPPVPESKSPRKRKKAQPSEAEPEQLFINGAEPLNIITHAKEAPVETADAQKVTEGFSDSVEKQIREEAHRVFGNSAYTSEEEASAPLEDNGAPDDYNEVEQNLKERRGDAVLKSVFLGIIAVILLILDLFALKSRRSVSDLAVIFLILSIALTAISLALSAPIVRKGLKQIASFKIRADGAALVCSAVAILQNIVLIFDPTAVADGFAGVYNFIPAVILLFIRLGELRMIKHIRGNIRFIKSNKSLSSAVMIEDDELTDDLVAGQISGEPTVCAPRKTEDFVGVTEACELESDADRRIGYLFIGSFIAAAVVALASAVWRGASFPIAFSVFTAALCAGTPLMAVFVTVLPLTRINNLLNRKGGAILNYNSAVNIADANCIIISDTDAFPDHSIVLHSMSLFNNASMYDAITDTVSVLSAAGGALGKVFEGSIADKSSLRAIDSIEYVDEMGIVCRSQGRELLLGSRDFMKAYQIPVPSSSYEARISGNDRHVFYLASNMELSAMYVVTYGVSDLAKRRLHRAEVAGLTLLIATKDTNVTKEILSNRMNLDNATVKVISARALDKLERVLRKAKSLPAGVIINDECCALPETAVCAVKLKSRVSFNIASLIASAIIGIIFVGIFSLAAVPTAIEAWKILVYALFWTLPVLVLSSSHK